MTLILACAIYDRHIQAELELKAIEFYEYSDDLQIRHYLNFLPGFLLTSVYPIIKLWISFFKELTITNVQPELMFPYSIYSYGELNSLLSKHIPLYLSWYSTKNGFINITVQYNHCSGKEFKVNALPKPWDACSSCINNMGFMAGGFSAS